MNGLDIAISLVVFVGLWRGFSAGAIKTLASMASWLLALILASKFSDDFAIFFTSVIDNPILQIALAFVSIMVAVVVIVGMVAGVIAKSLKVLKLGFIDRMAGALLGAMTGVLKVLIVLSVAAPLLAKTALWQNSVLSPALLPYAPVAKTLLQEAFGETYKQLENPYQNQ